MRMRWRRLSRWARHHPGCLLPYGHLMPYWLTRTHVGSPAVLPVGTSPLDVFVILYLSRSSNTLRPTHSPSMQYHYHSLAPRGSGEFALRHLLAPFAWPHAPLEERMAELDVPITFI